MSDDIKITDLKEVVIGPNFDDMVVIPAATYGPGGMSLRDWFAGQAMKIVAQRWQSDDDSVLYGEVARGCYEFADAMLEARKR